MMRRNLVVAIPARDEQPSIDACLRSVLRAVSAARRHLLDATVVVAADSCRDQTAEIVARLGGVVVEGAWGSPARARNAAVEVGVGRLESADLETYVLTTDADTTVPEPWVGAHLAAVDRGADAVASGLRLRECSSSAAAVIYAARLRARLSGDGQHVGVYGANLGVRLDALRAVGGFPDVPVGEDRELVARLRADGWHVAQPLEPMVTTSGRLEGRAAGGLADLLRGFAHVAPAPIASDHASEG